MEGKSENPQIETENSLPTLLKEEDIIMIIDPHLRVTYD